MLPVSRASNVGSTYFIPAGGTQLSRARPGGTGRRGAARSAAAPGSSPACPAGSRLRGSGAGVRLHPRRWRRVGPRSSRRAASSPTGCASGRDRSRASSSGGSASSSTEAAGSSRHESGSGGSSPTATAASSSTRASTRSGRSRSPPRRRRPRHRTRAGRGSRRCCRCGRPSGGRRRSFDMAPYPYQPSSSGSSTTGVAIRSATASPARAAPVGGQILHRGAHAAVASAVLDPRRRERAGRPGATARRRRRARGRPRAGAAPRRRERLGVRQAERREDLAPVGVGERLAGEPFEQRSRAPGSRRSSTRTLTGRSPGRAGQHEHLEAGRAGRRDRMIPPVWLSRWWTVMPANGNHGSRPHLGVQVEPPRPHRRSRQMAVNDFEIEPISNIVSRSPATRRPGRRGRRTRPPAGARGR